MITLLQVSETTGGSEPTLYAWAGGSAAFNRLINAFYDRLVKDYLLSPIL